jgi:hypothetical protein
MALTTRWRKHSQFEAEFATYLGHVYAHLNRAWNGRNLAAEATDEQRIQFTQFPTDLLPVG